MAKRVTKGTTMLRRRADEVRNYRIFRRITIAVLGCLIILLLLLYVISVMYTKYGSFTVSVNKYHQLKYGLSLCENKDFNKPTSRLECQAVEEITNIDGSSLDGLALGALDGQDSGTNYLCYTFYCRNAGTEILDYDYSIDIANMTLGVEQAVRVRLITNRNGENATKVDYARAAGVDDQNNSIPEPNTVPFYDKYTVMRDKVEQFAPGEVCKYTVVIWLEGNDPECVDEIIGGEFKIDMKFTVSGVADVEDK